MFLLGSHRCFIPNGPLLSSMTRLFSTSSTPQAGYKMKSHSGTKKRWRSLGSGDAFKRGHAARAHLNVSKGSDRVNRLGNTAYSSGAQTPKLKKRLLPYGTS
ncbi:50S ribosomal protein L35 [Pleurotus pulmonarius]|nr:hypothetical protein EYR38_009484 [Pleurotus pulmonarius]